MADKKRNIVIFAAGWNKTNDSNFSYTSLRFNGVKEDDQYEVILRRKEDQAELLLGDHNCIAIDNGFKDSSKKEHENKPDLFLKVFLPDEA